MIAAAPITAVPIATSSLGADWLSRAGWGLSVLVHAGIAAAVIGWGRPAAEAPRLLAVSVVMMPAEDAGGGEGEPGLASASAAPPARTAPPRTAPARPAPPPSPEMAAAEPATASPAPAPPPAPAPARTDAVPADPVPAPAQVPAVPLPADPPDEPRTAAETTAPSLPRPAVKPAPPASLPTAAAPPQPTTPVETQATQALDRAAAPRTAAGARPQEAAIPGAPPAAGPGQAGGGAGPGMVPAAALANPEPRYPTVSRRRGEEGRVVLLAEVSAAGSVTSLTIRRSSGHERLDRAALEAVRRWRFAPAHIGERAVASTIEVPVVFALTGSD